MLNDYLYLQPNNYCQLDEELCLYLGDKVSSGEPEVRDGLVEEILETDHLTVCSHRVKDDQDSYTMMTKKYMFVAKYYPTKMNFAITRIFHGKEFQSQKKYLYNRGVFLVETPVGISIVVNRNKQTSCSMYNDDWGMTEDGISNLCDKMNEYFSGTNQIRENQVDSKFDRQIIQPIRNYTKYEDQAVQIDAYKNDYIDYDYYVVEKSRSRRKVYSFFSSSFNPDNELYRIGDRVAIETGTEINEDLYKKIHGTIIDRIENENGTLFEVEILDQFDNNELLTQHGHIFIQANETQKRIRERVIQNIISGNVDSTYMYSVFSKGGKPTGYESADDWDDFYTELLNEKYPPNESQMEAIKRGIETKDIQLVLGPPGTGKTTVIVSWVKYFIRHGKRVLVSSQNNSAVDNVLERIGKDECSRIIRLGNIDKIQDNCKQYSPEYQVESASRVYTERIENSISIIDNDIHVITGLITFIDKVVPEYELLMHYRDSIVTNRTEIKNIYNRLVQLYAKTKESYSGYRSLYEKRLHKDICLYVLNRGNRALQIILFPLVFHIRKQLDELSKKVEVYALQYIRDIENYNSLSEELIKTLNKEEYKDAKINYSAQFKKCRTYSFEVDLRGPFKLGGIEEKYLRGESEESIEKIVNFREKAKNILIKLEKVEKSLKDWKQSIITNRTEIISNLLIENSNIVGATCIGINTREKFRNLKFDVSIIDESGQIQVHNAIVPMTRAPKTLMLGDHLQIPPMANDTVVKLCNKDGIKTDLLEQSFFEYLFTKFEKQDINTPNLTRLNEQFRMPGNISDVISKWFYNGNYHAHYNMAEWKPMVAGTSTPLIVISTSRERNRYETPEEGGGYSNRLEADIAVRIVELLGNETFKYNNDGVISPQVGIISGYGKQVRLIRQIIKERRFGYTPDQIYSVAASLDSFQGQERPVIIYSSTRSADPRKVPPTRARVGFLKELRRLNVAFTRCQRQLIIIGDFDYLTSCEYEKTDDDTGEPLPHQSEKKYSEFMKLMIEQAKSKNGEFYYIDEFIKKLDNEK